MPLKRKVILLHVKDLQLALLIARLVEVRDAEDLTQGFGGTAVGGVRVATNAAVAAFALLKGPSRKVLREEFLPAFDGENNRWGGLGGQRVIRSRCLGSRCYSLRTVPY